MLTLEWAAETNARAKRLAVREAHRQLCGVVCPTAYFVKEHLAGAKIKILLDTIEMVASGLQKTLFKKRKKKQGKPQSKDKTVLCTHLTETSVQNLHSTTQISFSRQRTRNSI